MRFILLLLLLAGVSLTASAQSVVRIDSLPAEGILLNQGWKWHAGDNPAWAKADFNDTKWEGIDPSQDIDNLSQVKQAGFGWFRLRLQIDPKLANTIVRIQINQILASEVYLDGRRIATYGKVSLNPDLVEAYNPAGAANSTESAIVQLGPKPDQVLAVRFALEPNLYYARVVGINPCLTVRLRKPESIGTRGVDTAPTNFIEIGIFLILLVLHLTFYFSFRSQIASLYFSYFCLFVSAYMLLDRLTQIYTHSVSFRMTVTVVLTITYFFSTPLLLIAIYRLFSYHHKKAYILLLGFTIAVYISAITKASGFVFLTWMCPIVLTLEALRVSVLALKKKKAGARIIVLGTAGYLLFTFAFIINLYLAYNSTAHEIVGQLFWHIGLLFVPISFTIFTAKEFARTSLSLQKNLDEVKQLSAEKEQILTTQNETLELQVNERTAELSHKNQELVIEAALERVRSRSLAMQHSDQLHEVITVVSEQLQGLGFAFGMTNFVKARVPIEDGTYSFNSIPGISKIMSFDLPYLDHKIFNIAKEAFQQRLGFYTYELTREEKDAFLKHSYEATILRDLPEERKQQMYDVEGWAISTIFFLDKQLSLSLIKYQLIPYTDEENTIFKRFGAVFEQAYVRFLDLQKAEAQAREAKIEAALERVRSRSLAMHSSEELKEVITLVFAQLNQLDIAITDGAAVIVLFSEDSKDVIHWTANPDRISEATRFRLPYIDHPMHNFYWDAREKGLDFIAQAFTLEEKNSFWEQALIVSDYKYAPEKARQWVFASPGYACSFAIGKHSAMLMDSYAGKMYSERENDILKRFARVFEQAYVRFLDLQKAEEQAREAQIETALERVRSQSMAMQQSDHLQEVITVVSEQLQALGFQFDYVNFVVLRADRGWDSYSSGPTNNEIVNFTIPYVDHKLFSQGEEALQQGVDFFAYSLTPDEKAEWLSYLFSQTILKDAPEEYKQSVVDLPGMAGSVVCSLDLGFSIVNYQGISYTDTENAIFKRFGAVFGQAYTRFKDLKKAEEQARQAIQTASLDRVRAQIASMRTTQDLERITPLIWTELTTLEVPFFRCGVFIINPDQHRIQAFLSTPDGHSRTQLNLAINESENNQQLMNSWQQQQVYRDRWSHEQLQQWVASMVEEGQMDSQQEYEVVEEVKEAFSLQFIPFRQGMLYVGSQEPLTDSQLDLTQSLADAFSVAYARYEDFRQLEEAKARVDATLTELKATQTQLIQKEKMASLGELTAGIAHEIQNPLNFVNNFSEVSAELVSELEDEQQKLDRDPELEAEILGDLKQNLQKITHHGGRASAIVRGMLEHSRMGTGEKQLTNLNALADEYLRLAYQGLRAKSKQFNCELVTDFAADLGPVAVVPQEIGRVLLNLYNNAFYAVHEKQKTAPVDYQPTVTVSTAFLPLLGGEGQGEVEIRVEDNGAGIPDAIREKIFQPFFTTKPTGEGTGLGLSLSYDIITKGHSGTLRVETMPNEFTEFIITLPFS